MQCSNGKIVYELLQYFECLKIALVCYKNSYTKIIDYHGNYVVRRTLYNTKLCTDFSCKHTTDITSVKKYIIIVYGKKIGALHLQFQIIKS